jgi:rubrerythrin
MEIKVRALDGIEEKSVQQVEEELLKKHEQEMNGGEPEIKIDTTAIDNAAESQKVEEQDELSEEQVLSYIGKRYNKQIGSFDELMAERKESEELPEDVAAYLNFKKETGRGFDDFVKLKKDYDSMDPNQLLREYLANTQKGLDKEDIDILMEEYSYDEELDDESKVKKTKIARKKAIAEAKDYFNSQKEKYKLPLESSGSAISNAEKEEFEAYRQYTQQAKTLQEENERKRKWFDQKSEEVFSKDFKGFEFSIDDKKIVFSPGSAVELKKTQSTPLNFINKYLDESGLIKDAAGYHRALSIAMNPDKFAKYFYEQGLADATEDVLRKTKNINMSERRAPEVVNKGGMQVKSVTPDSGRNLKIRSIKKIN